MDFTDLGHQGQLHLFNKLVGINFINQKVYNINMTEVRRLNINE